jgi:23S rRNA pseudouridine955/2504/2580 synthase
MKQTEIQAIGANQRIDKFVRKWLNEAPLSFIYRLFRKKDVKVNGHWVPIDYVVKVGDIVTVYITDAQIEEFNQPKPIIPGAFPHQIIYEDDNCLIVNKPKGLLVHGDSSEKRLTLANQVLSYLATKGATFDNGGYMPSPAHRLDRNTSGIVIFGKTLIAQQALEKLFHDRAGIIKSYLALVVGNVLKDGEIDMDLTKNSETNVVKVVKRGTGMRAITQYRIKERFQDFTLLEVIIKTGRTHQIRVHFSAIGHPLVGDRKYGQYDVNRDVLKRFGYEHQFLHAFQVEFGELGEPLASLSNKRFVAPLPSKEHQIIAQLRDSEQRSNPYDTSIED